MFFETLKMSLKSLYYNKTRTFLTILGVVIGIMSIIALMTLVQGATDTISNELVNAGANKLTVTIVGSREKSGLTDKNLEEILAVDNVDYISLNVSGSTTLTSDTTSVKNVRVYGRNMQYFNTADGMVKYGRPILKVDCDEQTFVALISSKLADTLFGEGLVPLDYQIKINGISFTIVGVLDSDNSTVGSSNQVVIPYTTAIQSLNYGAVRSFDVFLKDTDSSSKTQAAIEEVLYSQFNSNEDAYSVFDMQVFLEMFDTVMSTMNGLVVGIAAISLLVGGIGIMNMMLVSVSERTREIGLRKALGAKPSIILLQFVLEAVFISLLGGIIGIVLGLSVSSLLGSILGVTPTVTADVIGLAVGFSAAVGLVFGILPARRAAKLNPIDALRSE